jgi:hypothetical protein
MFWTQSSYKSYEIASSFLTSQLAVMCRSATNPGKKFYEVLVLTYLQISCEILNAIMALKIWKQLKNFRVGEFVKWTVMHLVSIHPKHILDNIGPSHGRRAYMLTLSTLSHQPFAWAPHAASNRRPHVLLHRWTSRRRADPFDVRRCIVGLQGRPRLSRHRSPGRRQGPQP